MADVTGPIRTLPGSRHALPAGAKCDSHPHRDAVARVQGETDSMGSEMNDLCSECLADVKAEPRGGRCDWCKEKSALLKPTRDYEEGLCGRVYDVCLSCRELARDEAAAELADLSPDYDDF